MLQKWGLKVLGTSTRNWRYQQKIHQVPFFIKDRCCHQMVNLSLTLNILLVLAAKMVRSKCAKMVYIPIQYRW